MRIGLLECDHVDDSFRSIAGDYRDMFETLLGVELRAYDVWNGVLPDSATECDAWLCGGSRRSVFDDDEWIAGASAFVRDVHAAEVPYVGVCFGHQLLAQALGGAVERSPQGWGVGVRTIDIVRSEPWMVPPRDACRLVFMHQDQVTRLPDGSTVLARADHCEVAAFLVDESMLGIQPHPEFGTPYADALLDARSERVGAERAAEARRTLRGSTDSAVVAAWLRGFLDGTTKR